MASPQKEHGYTPIANEIMDALMKTPMSERCRRCLDCILRNTYGYQKKRVKISLSGISGETGISKANVRKTMVELETRKIIKIGIHGDSDNQTVIHGDHALAKIYEFNKNYDEWSKNKIGIHGDSEIGIHGDSDKKVLPLDKRKKKCRNSSVATAETEFSKNKPVKKSRQKSTPKKLDPDSPPVTLSNLLADLMKKNNPKCKIPSDIQTWAKHIDLMIRIDERTPEEIEMVIRFTQADTFEMANVLSTKKLRERFDQLFLKATRNNPRYVAPTKSRAYTADEIMEIVYGK